MSFGMTLLHKPSTRSLNRRILNEDGLISAVSKFVGIRVVQFDAISYAEQVQYVLPCPQAACVLDPVVNLECS